MEKIELEKFGHNFLRWPNCDKPTFHTWVLKGGDSDFKRLEWDDHDKGWEKKILQQWFKKGLKMYFASHVHVFVLYLVVNSVSNRDNLFI